MAKRILICDDDIYILRAAEIKFQHAGYEACVAKDGEEAWQIIGAQKPDLLITDFQMPRLDGLNLIRRIRETPATADLPILMLTGKGFELSHDELTGTWGVLAVISKPFSPRELLLRVHAILEPALAVS